MSLGGNIRKPQKFNDKYYEKYHLRKAFQDLLPEEIIWRRKEGFSDGVGGTEKPWYSYINDHINKISVYKNLIANPISDSEYFLSPEAYHYFKVFEKNFKNFSSPIPRYWMPMWNSDINDPSGRLIKF